MSWIKKARPGVNQSLDMGLRGKELTLGKVYSSSGQWAGPFWMQPTNSGFLGKWLMSLSSSSFQGKSGHRVETLVCEVAAGGNEVAWDGSIARWVQRLGERTVMDVSGIVRCSGLCSWRRRRSTGRVQPSLKVPILTLSQSDLQTCLPVWP